jgi:amino acid permease
MSYYTISITTSMIIVMILFAISKKRYSSIKMSSSILFILIIIGIIIPFSLFPYFCTQEKEQILHSFNSGDTVFCKLKKAEYNINQSNWIYNDNLSRFEVIDRHKQPQWHPISWKLNSCYVWKE